MSKPSVIIEDAQERLKRDIIHALVQFSDDTGLVCRAARWDVVTTVDAKGHTQALRYHSVTADLSTGAP